MQPQKRRRQGSLDDNGQWLARQLGLHLQVDGTGADAVGSGIALGSMREHKRTSDAAQRRSFKQVRQHGVRN